MLLNKQDKLDNKSRTLCGMDRTRHLYKKNYIFVIAIIS